MTMRTQKAPETSQGLEGFCFGTGGKIRTLLAQFWRPSRVQRSPVIGTGSWIRTKFTRFTGARLIAIKHSQHEVRADTSMFIGSGKALP